MLLAHAGNRIDSPDRPEPRFPAARVAHVEQRLKRFLAELGPDAVVSAAASGADLLVLDTARELGIPLWVVLPLPEGRFLEESVADQGQEWLVRYHRVRAAAEEVDVADLSARDDWYLRGNDVILDRAVEVAAGIPGSEPVGVLALVIRPAGHDGGSATDDFATKARSRKMAVIDIDPLAMTHQRAFVVSPFGAKEDPSRPGTKVNCDATFRKLIVPALEDADLDWSRADRAAESGLIHQGVFRDLAEVEVVVVDLTLENGNVLYELGMRHVMRPAATVLMHREGGKSLFDIRDLRELRFRLDGAEMTDGEATAALPELQQMIAAAVADRDVPDSPVHLLFELAEPVVRRSRAARDRVDDVADIASGIDRAERLARRPGDTARQQIPVLRTLARRVAAEVKDGRSCQALWFRLGLVFRDVGGYLDALDALDRVEVTPADPLFAEIRKEQAMCHRRLAEVELKAGGDPEPQWAKALSRLDEAFAAELLSADARGVAGGLEKRRALNHLAQPTLERALLRRAVGNYDEGSRIDPTDYYLLLNRITTRRMLAVAGDDDPALLSAAAELLPVARYMAIQALQRNRQDAYAHAALGELAYTAFALGGAADEREQAISGYTDAVLDLGIDQKTSVTDQLRIYRQLDANNPELLALLDDIDATIGAL